MSVADLIRATDRLVDQVSHWTPSRWVASGASGSRTRAEVVHALAQRLADLEAEVTGRPAIPVPRLDNDLALTDQVRVMVRDLVAAEPDDARAAAALDAIRRARREL